ncbi:MAG: hypothetical protein ABIN91_21370 [Mucilaginibacter sp.]
MGEKTSVNSEQPTFTWHCRPDMSFTHLLAKSPTLRQTDPMYEINPSIYRVLNEYRFIRTWVDADVKSREYQLQSIAYDSLIRDLVNFCKPARSRKDIIEQISKLAVCSFAESADYQSSLWMHRY